MPSDGTQKKKSSGWQRCGSSRAAADTGNVAAGAAGWAVEAVQTLSILPDEDNFPWGKLFWKRPQGNTPSLVITLLLCDWFRQMWVSQLSLWLWLCGSNGGAPTAQAPCPVMCCDTQLLICRTGEPRIQGNVSCGHKCAAEEVATLWLEAVMMSGRWLCPQDSSEGSVMWPVVGSLLEVSDPNTECALSCGVQADSLPDQLDAKHTQLGKKSAGSALQQLAWKWWMAGKRCRDDI